MQVNLNTNINRREPHFGKLKGVEFINSYERSALYKNFPARKKILDICELPIIKKIFDKYDGNIIFSVIKEINRYSFPINRISHNAKCYVELECNKAEIEKIRKSYMYKGLEKVGICDSFEGIHKIEKVNIPIAEVNTESRKSMDVIENLIKIIRGYDNTKLDEIEKEYDIEAIERLNWYEKGCEEHLKGLIEFGCVTGLEEERLELSARIKRILGDS